MVARKGRLHTRWRSPSKSIGHAVPSKQGSPSNIPNGPQGSGGCTMDEMTPNQRALVIGILFFVLLWALAQWLGPLESWNYGY